MWFVGAGLCPARGRPQGSPLRKYWNACVGRRALTPPRWCGTGRAAGWGQPALRRFTRGSVIRAVEDAGPYGWVVGADDPVRPVQRSLVCVGGRDDVGIVPYERYVGVRKPGAAGGCARWVGFYFTSLFFISISLSQRSHSGRVRFCMPETMPIAAKRVTMEVPP